LLTVDVIQTLGMVAATRIICIWLSVSVSEEENFKKNRRLAVRWFAYNYQ